MVLAGENCLVRITPMMHAYVKLGVMPAGQVVTRFPDKLEGKPARFYVFGEPFFKAEELQKMVSSAAPLDSSTPPRSIPNGAGIRC